MKSDHDLLFPSPMWRKCVLTMVIFVVLVGSSFAQNRVDTAVHMRTAVDNVFLCPGKKDVYLYIDLEGCNLGKRVPLNLSVVFDRSGSMDGERIKEGRAALDYLIDHLESQDILSIVTYDHQAEVFHGAEPVADKNKIKGKLHHVRPRGATNISGGLQLGFQEASLKYDPTKINRMFLLTDGLANEGVTDDFILEQIVHGYSQQGNVSLSTFGLGHEYNEVLLHNLAEAGGGHFYHIDQPQDAQRDFGSEIKTLLSVVAQNAKLTVAFPPELEQPRVYGERGISYGNTLVIDLKEVHPQEQNGILVKFQVKSPLSGPVSIQTTLVYDNALTLKKETQVQNCQITPSPNSGDCEQSVNRDVLERIVYYTSNDLVESAITDAENGNISGAKAKMAQSKQLIQNAKRPDSLILKNQMQMADEYDSQLDTYHKKSEEEIKILHKRMRYKNYKLRKLKRKPMTNNCPKL